MSAVEFRTRLQVMLSYLVWRVSEDLGNTAFGESKINGDRLEPLRDATKAHFLWTTAAEPQEAITELRLAEETDTHFSPQFRSGNRSVVASSRNSLIKALRPKRPVYL